eukprot:CAMPEP_0195084556 /NCGR_PEP_ID=MMETSP0448-20130528/25217_1 /TAXON_ID=66468 /ORGANISM="Heterocapsa triquestra, Strain CCMP 448" /LENGTH=111 /DNA_ID=CAMNT_0040117889 /DNA_START=183 /DNA_END=519 /DNA_ORIENTATION=+
MAAVDESPDMVRQVRLDAIDGVGARQGLLAGAKKPEWFVGSDAISAEAVAACRKMYAAVMVGTRCMKKSASLAAAQKSCVSDAASNCTANHLGATRSTGCTAQASTSPLKA